MIIKITVKRVSCELVITNYFLFAKTFQLVFLPFSKQYIKKSMRNYILSTDWFLFLQFEED